MDKVSREKFHEIKSGDRVFYLDPAGCECQADVVGWRNVKGEPALLVGEAAREVPFSRVLSRRRGSDRKEWKP